MNSMWKFVTGLFGHEQDMPPHGKVALPLILVGLGLVNPGWKDAALSYLNKTFGLGLSLDAPWWVGAILIAAGVVIYLAGELRRTGETRRFVAIRH